MTQEQFDKLDSFYIKLNLEDNCVEETVDARSLLSSQRFDLYAILLYIDHYVKGVSDMSYARNVYMERTKAITSHTFTEIGNENNKNSFDCFTKTLESLVDAFRAGTYDYEKTLVPIDKNGILMDGAHRASCAAYFGKQIKVLRFLDYDSLRINQDYLCKEYFMPTKIADAMALEACKWHNNLYMIFLWPKANLFPDKKCQALDYIEKNADVVYSRSVKFSYDAMKNLMIQLYGHMDWIGSPESGFQNIYGKIDEVWDANGEVKILLARVSSADAMRSLKEHIRDIFGIGLSSVHSTDNEYETSVAANALLNPNSLDLIMKGNPVKFAESYLLFDRFKRALEQNNAVQDYIVDSSMVLAMYGIRKANDLDYYTIATSPIAFGKDIEEHDIQSNYHAIPIVDMILSPGNYFTFYGVKFVCLKQLLLFKQSRLKDMGLSSDLNDIRSLEKLLSKKSSKAKDVLQSIRAAYTIKKRRFKADFGVKRRKVLEKLHLYDFARNFYHNILKR